MAIRLKTDRLTVIHLFLNLKENGHQYACPQQALHYKIRRVHFSNTRFKTHKLLKWCVSADKQFQIQVAVKVGGVRSQ